MTRTRKAAGTLKQKKSDKVEKVEKSSAMFGGECAVDSEMVTLERIDH